MSLDQAWCRRGLVAGMTFLLGGFAGFAAELVTVEPLGLRVARGFRVSLWAEAGLANDIRSMTLDARGRVVVSGPGYIRTLLDNDGNGMAETAVDFAMLASGAQGMYWDGPMLWCVGDGALRRYADLDENGQADGPPETLLPLDTSGHGAGGVRKGPDGWMYVITGEDVAFGPEHISLPGSPIPAIQRGAVLRLRPEGAGSEALADGFRNPRDLAFNWLGDMFTMDGDVPGDMFLPWYVPARLHQVGWGLHHGWQARGARRSWPQPSYAPDAVTPLAALGPAIPSGVACYRHAQFPPAFRNGLFFADWSSGRVWFTPLLPEGATYRVAPEVFLEPVGTFGFAPIDLAVAPDGALLVAAGGGNTQGAIYRIEYPPGVAEVTANNWLELITLPLASVLNAPQPLAAWSRAVWADSARRLGPEPFAHALADERLTPSARVRAVEVLTELYGGLAPAVAAAGARSPVPFVRARVAWALGRSLPPNGASLLLDLAQDPAPAVRRSAVESLADQAGALGPAVLQPALAGALGDADPIVRQQAARLASLLPEAAWRALWTRQAEMPPPARLAATLAFLWRSPPHALNADALQAALSVIPDSSETALRLEAVRLAMQALGGYRLEQPTLEVFAPYEPAVAVSAYPDLVRRIQQTIRAIYPAQDPDLNREAARLLAFVQDDARSTTAATLGRITAQTPPAEDFHYLAVLARLTGPMPTNAPRHLADAILSLRRKLPARADQAQLQWKDRLAEVVQTLLRREPELAEMMLAHPDFVAPEHVMFVSLLGTQHYEAAARRFLAEVKRNPRFPWSGLLVDVLASLPDAEVRPLLRQQWSSVELRDDLLIELTREPQPAERDMYLAGLSSPQGRVLEASLAALEQLPPSGSAKGLAPALLLLRRLLQQPADQALRARVLDLIEKETRQSFQVRDVGGDPDSLQAAYQPVFDWSTRRYPQVARVLDGDESPAVWKLRLKAVRWESGEPGRGRQIFLSRGCQMCHSAGASIGPALSGAAMRYSPTGLMNAILYPHLEVAEPYRNTTFRTVGGQTFTGLVVSETPESILLQTSAMTTVRLHPSAVAVRQPTWQSLMPTGLLRDLGLQDLADLYSYLKSL